MVDLTREFNRRYSGMFISYPKDGINLPFMVDEANGEEGGPENVTGQLLRPKKKGTGLMYEQHQLNIDSLNLTPPSLGVINLETVAAYLCWKQTRQFRCGFHRDRVMFSTAMTEALPRRAFFLRGILSTKSDVYNVFNPQYYSPESAFEMLTGENASNLSVAISDKFWMALSPVVNHILIGYKMYPVGIYDEENNIGMLMRKFSRLSESLSEVMGVDIYENF